MVPANRNDDTGTGGGAWSVWIDSTATTSSTTTWNTWTSAGTASNVYTYRQRELTAEEQQAIEANRAALEAEQKNKEAARAKAEKVAEELLLDHLSASQKTEWSRSQFFELVSPKGRRLRLTRKRTSNVLELDAQGKQIGVYCIHPDGDIPLNDQLLMQKMAIEHHEDEFFQIAIKRG